MNSWMEQAGTSLQTLADKGGPTMVALGLLSVAVVAVFIARALALAFQGNTGLNATLARAARAAAEDHTGRARNALEAIAAREAARLRTGFRFMDLAATAAPLLGLLGTVLGMIEAFRQLEAAGTKVNPSLLAGGIWEALLTTAAGMVVALVTLVCLSILESLAERVSGKAEAKVNAILGEAG